MYKVEKKNDISKIIYIAGFGFDWKQIKAFFKTIFTFVNKEKLWYSIGIMVLYLTKLSKKSTSKK